MNLNIPNRRSFLQRSLLFLAGLTASPLLGRNKTTPSVSDALQPVVSSTPFVGEIMLFTGDFAPRGWAFCHGQTLPSSSNAALFSLLGTTYGGNGSTTFGLPDLRGRMAVGGGSSVSFGETGGTETTTLLSTNIPPLSITLDKTQIRTAGTQGAGLSEGGTVAGASPNAMATNGTNTPINNMPPFLAMNYIISLQGLFPSRS